MKRAAYRSSVIINFDTINWRHFFVSDAVGSSHFIYMNCYHLTGFYTGTHLCCLPVHGCEQFAQGCVAAVQALGDCCVKKASCSHHVKHTVSYMLRWHQLDHCYGACTGCQSGSGSTSNSPNFVTWLLLSSSQATSLIWSAHTVSLTCCDHPHRSFCQFRRTTWTLLLVVSLLLLWDFGTLFH